MLESVGTGAAKMATADPVVENLNVVEDIGACQIPNFVNAFADVFLLQTAEKRFCDSVVPTVTTPTHARQQTVSLAEPLPVVL